MKNETYLGYKGGLHSISFTYSSNPYIARVRYDRNKNVQIIYLSQNLFLTDVEIDYLECFAFKKVLQKEIDGVTFNEVC